jgi:hypothetical protein
MPTIVMISEDTQEGVVGLQSHHRDARRTHEGAGQSRQPVVVIANDGDSAAVVIVPLPSDEIVGSTFEHSDRSWVVTAPRPNSRVFFASPHSA